MNRRDRMVALIASTLMLLCLSVRTPAGAQQRPVPTPTDSSNVEEFVQPDPDLLLINLDDAVSALDSAFAEAELERDAEAEISPEDFKQVWLDNARRNTLENIQDAELTVAQLSDIISQLVPEGLVAEEAVVTIGVSSVKKTAGNVLLFKIINFGRNRESAATHSITITYKRPPA